MISHVYERLIEANVGMQQCNKISHISNGKRNDFEHYTTFYPKTL